MFTQLGLNHVERLGNGIDAILRHQSGIFKSRSTTAASFAGVDGEVGDQDLLVNGKRTQYSSLIRAIKVAVNCSMQSVWYLSQEFPKARGSSASSPSLDSVSRLD